MRARVQKNQTLLDVAVQRCGALEAAMDIALLNGLSISDTPVAGTELLLPAPIRPKVVAALAMTDAQPASAITNEDQQSLSPEGVGFWRIGYDFVIS